MGFLETLKGLTLSKQITLVITIVAVAFMMVVLVQQTTKPGMSLLYSGLGSTEAGEVVGELEKMGIPYDVRGEAIYIEASKRDQTRLMLAKDGLPRPAVSGYELLDEVNGFAVTSEMYNASYWRAKEGELARTILSMPEVSGARVHIGASLKSGLSRLSQPHSASVSVTARRSLSVPQAKAIQHLVALAVSGVSPEDVVVIDSAAGIVAGPGASDNVADPSVKTANLAAQLEAKLLQILEARVGSGNARVSVAAEIDFEQVTTSEVSYDPDSRVLRSRRVSEESESNSGSQGGAVSVASNLPAGDAQGQNSSSGSRSVSSENSEYEISQLRRETQKGAGSIKKLSVAVLINSRSLADGADGAALTEAETTAMQALVTSAVGLDVERGDILSIEFLPFAEMVVEEELLTETPLMERLLERYLWSGIQAVLLGLVIIVLAIFVLRPMLRPSAGAMPALADGGANAAAQPMADGITQAPQAGAMPGAGGDLDPAAVLRDFTNGRQDEATAVLEEWLNEDRKMAS
jgi:flagellar M-ring protein FliF